MIALARLEGTEYRNLKQLVKPDGGYVRCKCGCVVFIRDSGFVFADGSAERIVFLCYRCHRSVNVEIPMEAE